MFRRRRGVPIPEEGRLDRMSEGDLFLALESSLMGCEQTMRSFTQEREKEWALAQLERHLEQATAVTKAMRRKYLVANSPTNG